MALGVNTNIASLNAQRNLTRSQDTLNTALQRLSTGLRINSAKDDAAGLAISTRFTTQINGLNQAVRNANDGISLSQTGEAALDEITNNLQRIRELAVQSANATNSVSDRAAIDLEVQQRLSEISRIGSQTAFNGQRILDGSFGTAQFQVGANVGDTISISLSQGVKATQIGQIATQTSTAQTLSVDTSAALNENGLTIALGTSAATAIGASEDLSATGVGRDANSAYAKIEAINGAGITGLTATASTSVDLNFDAIDGSGSAAYDLTINGAEIYDGFDVAGGEELTGTQVAAAINLNTAESGVTATFTPNSPADTEGTLTLTASDGRNITIAQDTDVAAQGIDSTAVVGNDGGAVDFSTVAATTATVSGNITLSAQESIALSGQTEAIGFTTDDTDLTITVDSTTLSSVSVTNVANAEETIQRVDSALSTISDQRSTFGAIQSRFESTIANLQTVSENLSASRSRILDADFAAETASLTRSQILQQAGISVLSQANAIPQNVLALLQ